MDKPTLLILAAGIGSRYGGFKQVDPVGPDGEIVLDYSAFDAWRAGFGQVVFVIQADLEQALREHFDSRLQGRLRVTYVPQKLNDLPNGFTLPTERRKPWGTGHAIWTARNAIDGAFAVINADDFYGPRSYRTMAEFLCSAEATAPTTPTFCMVAFRLSNTLSAHGSVSRGICTVDRDGYLSNVVERTKIEPSPDGGARFVDAQGSWQPLLGNEPASMNMWGFTPEIFPALEREFVQFLESRATDPKAELFIPTVVDDLIKADACRTAVLHTDEKWFGMTYREDREKVTESIADLITAGTYPCPLWS